MTDREMLEFAAKAGGYNYSWSERYECAEIWSDGDKVKKFWQPHVDDGDALRLAVTLGFVIDRNPAGTIIYAGLWGSPKWEVVDVENGDYIAATRRAITSAAAQIGKEMK